MSWFLQLSTIYSRTKRKIRMLIQCSFREDGSRFSLVISNCSGQSCFHSCSFQCEVVQGIYFCLEYLQIFSYFNILLWIFISTIAAACCSPCWSDWGFTCLCRAVESHPSIQFLEYSWGKPLAAVACTIIQLTTLFKPAVLQMPLWFWGRVIARL